MGNGNKSGARAKKSRALAYDAISFIRAEGRLSINPDLYFIFFKLK